jgi:hypothetical protein
MPVIDTGSLIKNTQIFPAAGRRDAVGAVSFPGTNSDYYSSTPASSAAGYFLQPFSSTLWPIIYDKPYTWGFSIRCVRI